MLLYVTDTITHLIASLLENGCNPLDTWGQPFFMSYKDDLLTSQWKIKRNEIIELAGNKCEYCSDEHKPLEVHHGVYLRGKRAWEYPNEVLYCLCRECHFTIQELMEQAQYEIGKRQLRIYNVISGAKRDVPVRNENGDATFDESKPFLLHG